MKSIKHLLWLTVMLPATAWSWQWMDLWQTPDQQGAKLLQKGKAENAAQVFKDKNWQNVSYYRAGNYEQAFKQFNHNKTSDGQYNAGNAAAHMGKYQEAITAYDKAIALDSNNNDALKNREIVKQLLEQKKEQPQQSQENKQNQQQKQDQNKDSSKNNKNDKSNSSSPQKNSNQNSGQQNPTDKQKQQQDNSKNSSAISDQQKNNANQNKPVNAQQKSGEQEQNVNTTTADRQQQRLEEDNQQLLRRLPDDPGGLLQQKFLRDYARRHGVEENSDQGVNQ